MSSAAKEAEKRATARCQIEANAAEETSKSDFQGNEVSFRLLHHVDSFSTKFMNTSDQFVLAVDKIDSPEIRSALIPAKEYCSAYVINSRLYDYTAKLSLNGGDEAAFITMLNYVKDHPVTKFSFDDRDEYLVFHVDRKGDSGIRFVFDLYDDGVVSEDPDFPSCCAAFEISKKPRGQRYTEEPVWEYAVTFHCSEDKRPKDAVIKSEYLVLQSFMRAAIASIGIFPSEL